MSANLALNKNTASNSYVAPFASGRAVDGQTQPVQRWVCAQLPASLTVDLGEYYWIDHIILKHMGVAGWSSRYNLKGFTLLGSTDNSVWKNIYSQSDNRESTNNIAFAPQSARWVQLLVPLGSGLDINPNVASLVEMEVYESTFNPYLSNLTLSIGALRPAFSQKTFEYAAEVENNVASITVTPTAEGTDATITVNNQSTQSGSPSPAINLWVGVNAIDVLVTNGPVVQKYTITVTRKSLDAAYLSELTIKNPRGQVVELTPPFQPTTTAYDANANYSSVTVTPVSAGNTIKVNDVIVSSGSPSNPISLSIGMNNIKIEVSPPSGGTTTTYTINVNRSS